MLAINMSIKYITTPYEFPGNFYAYLYINIYLKTYAGVSKEERKAQPTSL